MPQVKSRPSRKTSHSKPTASPALRFPSVETRLPSGRASTKYDQLGVPFENPSGDAVMDLKEFFGAPAIQRINGSGKLIFHMMGDSGVGTSEQEVVAEAMSRDIIDANHELGPSFMVHLGDIIYGPNKRVTYADRFYRMYDHYNRLVFAIPGNHDGEVFQSTDPDTLKAFKDNFCAPAGKQPPLATQFGVLMPNQPGPYWHLKAPFIDILGLYSNCDENVGIIANSKVGSRQKTWLKSRLLAIAADRAGGQRRALVIAVHHPPYARGFAETGFGHPGSPEMLADIDDCCTQAGILPHAVIAGHTHSYQHYVRSQSLNGVDATIPYLIVGTGGIGLQRLPAPTGVRDSTGMVKYYSAFKDYGYVTATASATELKLEFFAITATHRESREQIVVNLASQRIL